MSSYGVLCKTVMAGQALKEETFSEVRMKIVIHSKLSINKQA